MFFFGIDVPLVELIVAVGIVTVIILFESIILLYLILHHRKDIKVIRNEIKRITEIIMQKR